MTKRFVLYFIIFVCCAMEVFGAHAIALFGTPKYPRDFSHFAYANPQAPKGGTLKSFELGDFNSLNPFVQKGNAAQSILALVYETLGVGVSMRVRQNTDSLRKNLSLILRDFF